jgi:type I restriction enzyme S subunit
MLTEIDIKFTQDNFLSELPRRWSYVRFKDVGLLRNEKTDEASEVEDYLELEDIESGTGRILNRRNTLEVESAVTLFKKGDILFGKLRPYLEKFYEAEFNGKCTGEILAFKPDRIEGRFLFYCLASPWFIQRCNVLAYGAKMPRVNWPTQLATFDLPLPPRDEQRLISAYLDASCAAIDAAVAAKQRQLETLDELRKSTIQRAATRGLNPKVRMQRTEVGWIPEMPEHWRLVRIKDVMQFFNTVRVPLSAAERGLMTERTYDYYGASGVIDKVDGYLFDGTYILIAEDGANLLTRSKPLAFLATGKFWVNNHAHLLKPRWGGDDTFFVNLLESHDFSLFVTGAAQPKLTMENLGRFKLAVPKILEQREIAAFIREKDAEFRPLFTQIERQIATLTAYRKSLIHECVTGKRRITEADLNKVQAHG